MFPGFSGVLSIVEKKVTAKREPENRNAIPVDRTVAQVINKRREMNHILAG